MRILSASEAIGPAWERTKAIFFEPFRWGRSWKLAAVAYVAQMGALFLPTPMQMMFGARHMGVPRPAVAALLALVGVLLTAIMFLAFYLGSRMQFVLFEVVATRSGTISPLWAKYGNRVWRWIGLKLLLSIVATGVLWLVVLGPFRRLMEHMPQRGHAPGPGFLALLFALISAIFVGVFALMLLSSLLTDFALPFIALENASISEALGGFGQVVKADPGELFLYMLLKIALAIAFCIGGYIAMFLAEIATFIPCAIVGGIAWLVLRNFGLPGKVLLGVGAFLLFLLIIAWIFYLAIAALGYVLAFFQAYALYFLGGRYPLLGNLLEPPPAAPVTAIEEPQLPPLPSTPAADGIW